MSWVNIGSEWRCYSRPASWSSLYLLYIWIPYPCIIPGVNKRQCEYIKLVLIRSIVYNSNNFVLIRSIVSHSHNLISLKRMKCMNTIPSQLHLPSPSSRKLCSSASCLTSRPPSWPQHPTLTEPVLLSETVNTLSVSDDQHKASFVTNTQYKCSKALLRCTLY